MKLQNGLFEKNDPTVFSFSLLHFLPLFSLAWAQVSSYEGPWEFCRIPDASDNTNFMIIQHSQELVGDPHYCDYQFDFQALEI